MNWMIGGRITAAMMLGIASVVQGQRVAVEAGAETHASVVLTRLVTVDLDGVTLRSAVKVLAERASVRIAYRGEQIDRVERRVSLHVTNTPLGAALDRVLQGTGLAAIPLSPDVINLKAVALEAASVVQGTITGTVIDAKTHQPLRGATVLLDDATSGVLTNELGTFRVTASLGGHRITVRLIGYQRQSATVNVVDGEQHPVTVALDASVNTLDQVVVTGTVIQTELKAVPNAITVITAKQIEERGITQIQQLFRGVVPGLFATNYGTGGENGSGVTGGLDASLNEVTMFSRGASKLQTTLFVGAKTNPIKVYVDGIEVANPTYLSSIDPKSVERIEIIAGPQASTIYGSNAINGVMQIFTKRGTSSRPQFMLTLLSGFIQNNFGPALAPQHDDAAQVKGTENHLSYNIGGGWNREGHWTPFKQTTVLGGFGGVRLQTKGLTIDASLRDSRTVNHATGGANQVNSVLNGTYIRVPSRIPPRTDALHGETIGLTFGYVPLAWWSHELTLGRDMSNVVSAPTVPGYRNPRTDTLLSLNENANTKGSLRYATTVRVPVTSTVHVTVTAGGDGWHNLSEQLAYSDIPSTTGAFNSGMSYSLYTSRFSSHNSGAFFQSQVNVWDAFFVTYGLRTEWNPNFGKAAEPSWAPRYGLAYTHDIGNLTAKLRASYGRSTRPPERGRATAVPATYSGYLDVFGPFDTQLSNPSLGPEYQQGGEGGLELYWGSHGSLVLTRYNQTVDNLIAGLYVDSTASIQLNDPRCTDNLGLDIRLDGHCYFAQFQYVNAGSIRNQGWEVQSSVNTGPLTTKGTYSWTKSRIIGLKPQYRGANDGGTNYEVGRSFDYLPEHTWALTFAYGRATSSLSLTFNGTGMRYMATNTLTTAVQLDRVSLDKPVMSLPSRNYRPLGTGYTITDLLGTHQMTPAIQAVVQVHNLMDVYQNDYSFQYPVIGRRTSLGLRIRW